MLFFFGEGSVVDAQLGRPGEVIRVNTQGTCFFFFFFFFFFFCFVFLFLFVKGG